MGHYVGNTCAITALTHTRSKAVRVLVVILFSVRYSLKVQPSLPPSAKLFAILLCRRLIYFAIESLQNINLIQIYKHMVN